MTSGFYNYLQLIAKDTSYAKRMARLSNQIFGNVVRPLAKPRHRKVNFLNSNSIYYRNKFNQGLDPFELLNLWSSPGCVNLPHHIFILVFEMAPSKHEFATGNKLAYVTTRPLDEFKLPLDKTKRPLNKIRQPLDGLKRQLDKME